MQHNSRLEDYYLDASAVTIGAYDGVHLGHQLVVSQMVEKARSLGIPSVVVTFFPHPGMVLGKIHEPIYLTTPEERVNLLHDLGVEHVITLEFTRQLSEYSPDRFMQMLNRHLNIRNLFIGFDFALGKDREGHIERLVKIGDDLGFAVEVVSPKLKRNNKVSSSQIRQYIRAGEFDLAAELLGRDFILRGHITPPQSDTIMEGCWLSTVQIDPWIILPDPGAYACQVKVNASSISALVEMNEHDCSPSHHDCRMINIYFNKSVDFTEPAPASLRFVRKIRPAMSFQNTEERIQQLEQDYRQACEVLSHVR